MKVDLNGAAGSDLSGISSPQRGQFGTAEAPGVELDQQLGEDKTTLSGDSASVKALTAKAMQSAEIRQDKVEALRQAIQNGDYKIEPDKIAEAMMRHSG